MINCLLINKGDKGGKGGKDVNDGKKNAEEVVKRNDEQDGVKIKRPNSTKLKCFSPFNNKNFKKLSEKEKKNI
ncbi:TPA: hypothetical protein N2G30_004392 [Salmonella enterica]|nr:hypothetical protein [Salmonella enterica]